ncbi:MAG: squalene synthase HpnC, partial [Caulobacterales bacterium]|nr:squalene synthase HpnC [Caulobacterales bacterium]
MSVATEDVSADPPLAVSPETPSGKGAGDENFPVGSFLLPAELRPCVAAFYAFVRAADDIADNPGLAPHDKIARLDALEAALVGEPGFDGEGYAKAHALRAALNDRAVTDRHARDVLIAFRRDAHKTRYADWGELLDYCEYSANPVGRFLLDLHGERPEDYAWSDPLCSALQVLNHLQDCGDDHREMGRVYVPEDWMAEEGTSREDLAAPALTPAMRRVANRMLEATDALIETARRLPGALRSRRLAMESAVIVRLAARLSR